MKTLTRFVICTPLLLAAALCLAADAGRTNPELHQAIRRSDKSAIQALLKGSATPKAPDPRGNTALHIAALHSDAQIVQWLLEAGADPNATNHAGATPLHYAAGDVAKVQLLLDHGANPNARSKIGNTALIVAAGHPESAAVVELLLRNGADVGASNNRGGMTALFNAVEEKGGDARTVELLLQHGADPNTRMNWARRLSIGQINAGTRN